jgi:hypothetical protein
MRWVGYAEVGEGGNIHKSAGKLQREISLGTAVTDYKIILKLIKKLSDISECIHLARDRVPRWGSCNNLNESLGFMKSGDFLK